MAGIPNPDNSTQKVGMFGVLGNQGLSSLPGMTRANVEYTLKQRLKKGNWKDSSDEFWTGVDPDGVSPWPANYAKVISGAVKGAADPEGTTLPELTQDLNNYMSDKWNLLATGAIGGETGSGTSAFVNFASYSNGTSLPAEWDQVYSGSGTGQWGISAGQAFWYSTNSNNRECFAVYTEKETVTNYQRVGLVSSNTPGWFNSSSRAWNYILGRCNEDCDEFVYARMERYWAEIGCVAGGVNTVLATLDDFNYKSGVTYWLACGTTAGAGEYTYQLIEGSYPILTVNDTTYSVVDDQHRFGGMGARSNESGLGSNTPAQILAWGFGDNQPATTLGSGATMVRTSTTKSDVLLGHNVFPGTFFDVPEFNTADVFLNFTDGTMTVGMTGWYYVESHVLMDDTWVGRLQMWLYRNGLRWKPMGPHLAAGSPALDGIGGSVLVYLVSGDSIRLGYNASGFAADVFSGESTGSETFFTIALANRSRE